MESGQWQVHQHQQQILVQTTEPESLAKESAQEVLNMEVVDLVKDKLVLGANSSDQFSVASAYNSPLEMPYSNNHILNTTFPWLDFWKIIICDAPTPRYVTGMVDKIFYHCKSKNPNYKTSQAHYTH